MPNTLITHLDQTLSITPKRHKLQMRFSVDRKKKLLFIRKARMISGKKSYPIDKIHISANLDNLVTGF